MTKNIIRLTLCATLFALSYSASAQQPGKVPRIGFLTSTSFPAARVEAFRQGLRELSWVEGQSIAVEYRNAERNFDEAAAELVRLGVDLIVTAGPAATRSVKQATIKIPIVMVNVGDPVASGFVVSLARPGSNITGLSTISPELSGKRLELLKEAIPKVSRVAVFWNSSNPGSSEQLKEIEIAAPSLGLKLQFLEIPKPDEFSNAFLATTKGRSEAVILIGNPIAFSNRKCILEFAAKNRLPAMYPASDYVEDGGLMSYAPNISEQFMHAATYVDKILKGAKPADLPVEQPTKFELVINLKAAKQIGLTIPPNVLARADRVIK
jgi:putative ABC transport system substrate-binding protein